MERMMGRRFVAVPTTMVFTIVIVVLAAALAPASARHHGRTHDHWYYRPAYTWHQVPYGVPHALDRIDPSRPGGLDPSFTPRGR